MFKQTDSVIISACSITQKGMEGASIAIETEDFVSSCGSKRKRSRR